MREIVLGTAGHVDHGKTSLIKALTGIETDRLEEEKKRGITIELGFAYLDLACGHRLGIVDVPGHEKFVKNMVSGVAGIDIVAFIVAADEGIMPQTREHFEICRLMGVQQGIIVITKKDLVEDEWLEMVEEEVRDFCEGSFLEEAPLCYVSSTTNEGIDQLRTMLDEIVVKHDFKEAFGPFRLPVDRVFNIKGFGTVVTGTSMSGRTKVGEELQFYPSELSAKIRGLQVHSQSVETVEAGHRTAINMQGVNTQDINKGMVAATKESLLPSYILDCDFLYLASTSNKLKNRARVRVHLGSLEVMGRIALQEDDEILPNTKTNIQLLLEEPVAVWPGDRFVVRNYSPVYTIGGGKVLDSQPPRKRKRATEKDKDNNARLFTVLSSGDIDKKIELFVEQSFVSGVTFVELAIRLGIFGKQLEKAIQAPLSSQKIINIDSSVKRYISKTTSDTVVERIKNNLVLFHENNPLLQGISKEELRSALNFKIDFKAFNYCLSLLVKNEDIVQEGSLVRMASHQVFLQADQEKLQNDLLDWYESKGLFTATMKETYSKFASYGEETVTDVLAILVREEQLVKINEQLYFHNYVIKQLVDDITAFIKKEGEIDAPRFKQLTALTRKFSIPLLEYFDKIKLTIRVGDKRILRE